MPHHQDVLRKALQAFADMHGRWPLSIEELDPFGMRTFGDYSPAGFDDPNDEEICLRYTHRTGKAVVRVTRPKEPTSHHEERS